MVSLAEVSLWGATVGAVSLLPNQPVASFQYSPGFRKRGIEVAPLRMPLREAAYEFRNLPHDAFQGLPGLLADSLPDRYGHSVVNAWLRREGRSEDSLDVVERLCYTGQRGMGALEFTPAVGPSPTRSDEVHVGKLVALASEVLASRQRTKATFDFEESDEALSQMLQVGTSAGGARPKAVIAWNPATNVVRSGQAQDLPNGFEPWLLKFDGVSGSGDHGVEDPKDFCAIEWAYSEMAKAAGIRMTECRLLEEGGRRHFMTRRFDRTDDGRKVHMQSLGAIAHLDYNAPGSASYEDALTVMARLGLGQDDREQQVRRAYFNIIARNQDDHVKNIAFLMDRSGEWRLSPAYDVTYANDPSNRWLNSHQMTLNGRDDDFQRSDLAHFARDAAGLTTSRSQSLVTDVMDAVARWPEFAARAGVPEPQTAGIGRAHRTDMPR